MRLLILLLPALLLSACFSFGGFRPARETAYWTSHKGTFPNLTYEEYIKKKRDDMYACGIDPYVGSHTSIKQGLCMEAKGWYYTDGPVCTEWGYTEADPMYKFCREWRAKRGLPEPTRPK